MISGQAPSGELRRSERIAINLKIASRERGRGVMPATLATLSRHGCMLADGFFGGERLVWVKLPGLENQAGTVAWSDGRTAGIAFHQPLHPAIFARFAAMAGTQSTAIAEQMPANDCEDRIAQLPATRREQILSGHADPDAAILRRKKSAGVRGLGDLVHRSTPRRAEHRREERHASFDAGTVEILIGDRRAPVQNMSPSGIKARLPLDEGVGELVPVAFEGFPAMEGRIIWIKDGSTGIELPPDSIELN